MSVGTQTPGGRTSQWWTWIGACDRNGSQRALSTKFVPGLISHYLSYVGFSVIPRLEETGPTRNIWHSRNSINLLNAMRIGGLVLIFKENFKLDKYTPKSTPPNLGVSQQWDHRRERNNADNSPLLPPCGYWGWARPCLPNENCPGIRTLTCLPQRSSLRKSPRWVKWWANPGFMPR